MATKSLTVRVPVEILDRVKRRGKAAKFIVEAVREKLQRDEDAEIERSLLSLVEEPSYNDIDDFIDAQRRVMARND